jgi:hypothetical protein
MGHKDVDRIKMAKDFELLSVPSYKISELHDDVMIKIRTSDTSPHNVKKENAKNNIYSSTFRRNVPKFWLAS